MKKLPKWYQDYIAKVAAMSNTELLDEFVEAAMFIGRDTGDERDDRKYDAACAEPKKRLAFCGFLEAGEKS